MDKHKLSPEEQRAIHDLEQIAEKWPKTLWLYATGHSLHVMKLNEQGKRAVLPGHVAGYDSGYVVSDIEIPNDGGDW